MATKTIELPEQINEMPYVVAVMPKVGHPAAQGARNLDEAERFLHETAITDNFECGIIFNRMRSLVEAYSPPLSLDDRRWVESSCIPNSAYSMTDDMLPPGIRLDTTPCPDCGAPRIAISEPVYGQHGRTHFYLVLHRDVRGMNAAGACIAYLRGRLEFIESQLELMVRTRR